MIQELKKEKAYLQIKASNIQYKRVYSAHSGHLSIAKEVSPSGQRRLAELNKRIGITRDKIDKLWKQSNDR